MIRYDLKCDNGHCFDSWFASSDAFDELVQNNLVQCPHCGSTQVEKQLMVPGISAKSNTRDETVAGGSTGMVMAGDDTIARKLRDSIRQLHAHVRENSEYVGDQFAEEARKIHYQEKPARGIYGKASPDEARSLLEEGVDVMPLPDLPEDKN